jgi:hypothetical protein
VQTVIGFISDRSWSPGLRAKHSSFRSSATILVATRPGMSAAPTSSGDGMASVGDVGHQACFLLARARNDPWVEVCVDDVNDEEHDGGDLSNGVGGLLQRCWWASLPLRKLLRPNWRARSPVCQKP